MIEWSLHTTDKVTRVTEEELERGEKPQDSDLQFAAPSISIEGMAAPHGRTLYLLATTEGAGICSMQTHPRLVCIFKAV